MRLSFRVAFDSMLNMVTSPDDNGSSFCSKMVSYGLPAIGFIAGIPFLQAACDAAGGTEPGCTAFEIGTVVSYGLGAVWMINSGINRMRREPEETKIVNNSKTCYRVGQHAVANTLSVINTVIPAYISYRFNDSNPYYLLISVPVSYAFNAFAFYSLTDLAFFRRMIINFRVGESSLSNRLSQDINRLIALMINAPRGQYQALSRQLFRMIESNAPRDSLTGATPQASASLLNQPGFVRGEAYFLENLLETISGLDTNIRPSTWKKVVRLCFQAAFLVFPVTNIFVNKTLSRQAVELLFDSKIAIVFFSSIMVTVSAVIDTIFAAKTAGNIHDAIARKVSGEYSDDYLTVKKPKLAATFTILSLILAGLSSSSRIQIAKKTVGSAFIVVCAGINATIFEWYAQRDLSGRFFESGVILFNTPDAALIKDVRRLRAANGVVQKADPHQLNELLNLRA